MHSYSAFQVSNHVNSWRLAICWRCISLDLRLSTLLRGRRPPGSAPTTLLQNRKSTREARSKAPPVETTSLLAPMPVPRRTPMIATINLCLCLAHRLSKEGTTISRVWVLSNTSRPSRNMFRFHIGSVFWNCQPHAPTMALSFLISMVILSSFQLQILIWWSNTLLGSFEQCTVIF